MMPGAVGHHVLLDVDALPCPAEEHYAQGRDKVSNGLHDGVSCPDDIEAQVLQNEVTFHWHADTQERLEPSDNRYV